MRVLKSSNSPSGLVTIYDWNEKFLIKFELEGFEQTYKIRKMDLIDEKDIDSIITDEDFLNSVKSTFENMFEQFGKAAEPYV